MWCSYCLIIVYILIEPFLLEFHKLDTFSVVTTERSLSEKPTNARKGITLGYETKMIHRCLRSFEPVRIDENSKFKYLMILLILFNRKSEPYSKMIFRGSRKAISHKQIYDKFVKVEFLNKTIPVNVYTILPSGGGWITFNKKKKAIHLYGSAPVFGPPTYTDAKTLIRKRYKDYNITVTPDPLYDNVDVDTYHGENVDE